MFSCCRKGVFFMDLFRKKDIGALRSMAQNSGLTKNLRCV